MRYRCWVIIMLMCAITGVVHAESSDLSGRASMRYRLIGIHNVGASFDVSGWNNIHWSARALYKVGSTRNLVNGVVGVGYCMTLPLQQLHTDRLGHFIPISLGVNGNYYSWGVNCAYIGAEGTYNINVGTPFYQSFFAVTGKLGACFKMLDISLSYTYDLAPRFNQKYIYENPQYDFNAIHASIYERMQVGVRVTYYFTFGL